MTAVTAPPTHLLVVHLGPVQDFIAQARRTRDLWFGSHLLSELSRAAARSAATVGALIFPALADDDPELAPCDTGERDGIPPTSIANKIVVELTAGQDPQRAARSIRAAVFARWRAIADRVRADHAADLRDGIDAVWNEQIDSLLEFEAAWAPIDRSYARVRQQVEAALGGRRRLRTFGAILHHLQGAPASSLDGGRVSVLASPETRRARSATRRLLLGDGEHLDAVGVVKRRGGAPEQFLSVVNVAVAPWLRHAAQGPAAPHLAALRAACDALEVDGRRLDRITRRGLPAAAIFPYNASVLFAQRLPDVFEELGATTERAEIKARAWEQSKLRPLLTAAGCEPCSYVACIVADGDRLGAAIDELSTPDAHRALAKELGSFPGEARRIVEQDHDGLLVFAGGDDVLAFVPVCRAIACAERLRHAFAAAIGGAVTRAREVDRDAGHTSRDASTPTLSVGIGIGHVLDGMGHLRELGRRAERHAKGTRNALAVLVDRRSGGESTWSAEWPTAPATRLCDDVALLTATPELPATVPMTKVHELGHLLRAVSVPAPAYASSRAAALDDLPGGAMLRGEIGRILARVRRGDPSAPGTVGVSPEEVGLRLEGSFADLHRELERWVSRMQIAHLLASSAPTTTQIARTTASTTEELP